MRSTLSKRRVNKLHRGIQTSVNDTEEGKLSLQQCRDILCREGAEYTDEQVALIRKTLYALAEVDYRYHTRDKPNETIIVHGKTSTQHDNQQESHPLHPRLHRRAG